jgi:hypothetical protein
MRMTVGRIESDCRAEVGFCLPTIAQAPVCHAPIVQDTRPLALGRVHKRSVEHSHGFFRVAKVSEQVSKARAELEVLGVLGDPCPEHILGSLAEGSRLVQPVKHPSGLRAQRIDRPIPGRIA